MKNDRKQILVIRLSSLGDLLLTTPVLRALKTLYSGCHITFLCRDEYKTAIENNPHISRILTLKTDENEEEISNQIADSAFDLIVDLQNNFRSRNLLKNIKVPVRKFKKPTLKKFLLVNLKLNLYKHYSSIPELYAASVPGLSLDEEGLEFYPPESVKPSVSPEEKYIGFVPGSKHFTKRWPEEYFIQLGKLLNKYGYKILLFGGTDDKETCSRIEESIPKVKNLCSDNNLNQTAVDMSLCRLIIGNDSGLMHLASVNFLPLIVLFGSSVEQFGFAPYKREAVIVQNESLRCRPCSHFGKNECPKKHFKCMIDLTPNIVFEKIKKALTL